MIEWVRICRYCRLSGDTDDAVRSKISQGVWPEGILWKKAPDGTIRINVRNYNKWVEGQVYAPQAKARSKSTSVTKVSAVVSELASRRRQPTKSM